jgi:pyruvate formate-lyase activating enzyme-like uncharacterized protein
MKVPIVKFIFPFEIHFCSTTCNKDPMKMASKFKQMQKMQALNYNFVKDT